MANQWLRLWHDMPNDPKWRTIARVSGQRIGDVMAVYVHLLVCASNATERGQTQSFNCEDVATALDIQTEQVAAIVDAMQGRVLDGQAVAGWSKRQVEREDGSAERAKAWRETQKAKKLDELNAAERTRTQPERTRTPDEIRLEEEKCTHTPLREGWVLPKAYGDWAIAEFPHWTAETVRAIAATFSDHWRASGGSSADWDATWRKWCCDPLTQKAHPAPKAAVVKAVAAPPKTVPSNSAEQTQALLRQQEEHAAEVERQRLARLARRTQQEAA